jgi:integrase
MARRDALLIALMEMTGCRPGEALALRWEDIGERISIVRRLSGDEIVEGTKGGRGRLAPVLAPLRRDLAKLREQTDEGEGDYVIRTPAGRHWSEWGWRNFRRRHFVPALQRVEEGWQEWRERSAIPRRFAKASPAWSRPGRPPPGTTYLV